jgi:hypothetical protein
LCQEKNDVNKDDKKEEWNKIEEIIYKLKELMQNETTKRSTTIATTILTTSTSTNSTKLILFLRLLLLLILQLLLLELKIKKTCKPAGPY